MIVSRALLAFVVLAAMVGHHTWSAELFQLDDFQDGSLHDWAGGASPTNIATGGPDGVNDAYLLLTSNGTNGPGSRLGTINNNAAWTGDYHSIGAQRIAVDMANFSMSPLTMRAVLFGPNNEDLRWTSEPSQIVPPGSTWSTYEFFLFESELVQVQGAVPYASMIQDVLRLMFRHDTGPSPNGTPIAAQLGIDNVRLLPGGDFDMDGLVNGIDVDALVAAIVAGGDPSGFDIDGNAAVDADDLNEWLRLAGHLNLGPGKSYLPGDATLDGVVDGQDFIAWNTSKFTSTPAWTAGDFNADGVVDGQDFIIWNNNKFTASDVSVPEPALHWLGLLTVASIGSQFRKRIQSR